MFHLNEHCRKLLLKKLRSSGCGASCCLVVALLLGALPGTAWGQYSFVHNPFQSNSSGFYEQIGTHWGLQGPGWFLNFGGPVPGGLPGGAPAFGGFDPNSQTNFGTAFNGPNVGGFFQLTAGQGSNTSNISQTPFIMVPNGGTGTFTDTTIRPFVTGIIPVVGGAAGGMSSVSPLHEKVERLKQGAAASGVRNGTAEAGEGALPPGSGPKLSSAEQGDLSVAEIRASQAAASNASRAELDAILARVDLAAADGKPGLVKLYLSQALKRATGEEKRQIAERLRALK